MVRVLVAVVLLFGLDLVPVFLVLFVFVFVLVFVVVPVVVVCLCEKLQEVAIVSEFVFDQLRGEEIGFA